MIPATDSLLNALGQLSDPRDPRGVRHPFAGLLAVIFSGTALPATRLRFHRPMGQAALERD